MPQDVMFKNCLNAAPLAVLGPNNDGWLRSTGATYGAYYGGGVSVPTTFSFVISTNHISVTEAKNLAKKSRNSVEKGNGGWIEWGDTVVVKHTTETKLTGGRLENTMAFGTESAEARKCLYAQISYDENSAILTISVGGTVAGQAMLVCVATCDPTTGGFETESARIVPSGTLNLEYGGGGLPAAIAFDSLEQVTDPAILASYGAFTAASEAAKPSL